MEVLTMVNNYQAGIPIGNSNRFDFLLSKWVWFFLLGIFGLVQVHGQQLPHGGETGDTYYSQFRYDRAAKDYEKLAAKKNPKAVYVRRLVDCYQHLRNYPKFLEWAGKAASLPDAGANDFFYLGEAFQETGKYDSAKVAFKKALGTNIVDANTLQNYIESCDWAKAEDQQKEWFTVHNAQYLNTRYADFSPSVYKDSLYFVSDRPITPKEIREAKNKNNSSQYYGWTGNVYLKMLSAPLASALDEGLNKDTLNSPKEYNRFLGSGFHMGPMVFSEDGKRVYYTKTVSAKKVDSLLRVGVKDRDSLRYFRTVVGDKVKKFYELKIAFINRLELWYSDRNGSGWSEPKPFPYNGGVNYSVGHPAISKDGRYLYFTSDESGGKGGYDLYYSTINSDGSFSKPVNLASLNTNGDDEFPSIGEDNHLYFASNGRLGYGGLDIYQAIGSEGNWGSVHNLGKSINSDKDDFGYLGLDRDGEKGFISSNREGGMGNDDIYSFQKIPSILQVVVRENHSLKKIPFVSLGIACENGKGEKIQTNELGFASMKLEAGQSCTLTGHKIGFRDSSAVFVSNKLQLKNDTLTLFMDSLPAQVDLRPVTKALAGLAEKNYVVYYNFDRYAIREDAARVLVGLKQDLNGRSDYRILISSYCDSRGTDIYNYWLSRKRSEAVLKDLVASGIPKERIRISWFGNTKPINGCKKGTDCSEEEHQQNRRSDIKLVPVK